MSEFEALMWFPLIYGFLKEQPDNDFTKIAMLARVRKEITQKKPYIEFCSKLYWFMFGKKDGMPVFETMEMLGKERTLEFIQYHGFKLMGN